MNVHPKSDVDTATDAGPGDIAVVGMAAHLPGAPDIASYWKNLREGRSAVRRLTDEELAASGESAGMLRNPAYVPFAAPLDGFDRFDAEFFGFSPKEAAILDPQHRQFLEVAWEALENAGHPPEAFKGAVGVFAGCGMGSYFYFNICSNPALVDSTGMFLLRHTGNDKDFLSTRVSHVFDLKGPSLNLQTACSTSLVAVHYAAQALINGECDMALAGGVTIELPQNRGYIYKEGEVLSPDGVCHAFDHRAQGTVFGSGAGAVVLRRLEDALADGDHIWAVIKGSAVNNDGAAKAGYLAPSVEGQSACIATAMAVAGTPADTVDYIECHGTGTYLGDPIEVAALTEAFRRTTSLTGFARIGSVKTNIGHLDTAAGVASLIKATLALHHKEMPPSLNFEAPNPAIDFVNSPFRVNNTLTAWPQRATPRRAGINSLGVGGTNAHVVLEEAPKVADSAESDWPFQLLTLSARSASALGEASSRLAAHLRAHPGQPLADVAYTLKEGRRAFEHRRVLVAASHEEAAAMLDAGDPRRVFTQRRVGDAPEIVFMFPGGGAQYPNMARDLYETEPVFAEWMDRGLKALDALGDADIRPLWLPEPGAEAAAAERLRRPSLQLPLILIVEIALAKLWESWGVTPSVLIGHSMGENAAACVAGVMTLEEVVGLVHLRGKLFDTVPAGGMLSVPLSEAALAPYLGDLDIASVNAPELTVVSGPDAGLLALADRLRADGIESSRIAIDIAAHSRMLEPILAEFRAHLVKMRLSPPRIPIISNRSGQPLTDAEATSPDYWVAHLRGTVRFAHGMATLRQNPDRVYLEVGPGRALATLSQANGVMGGQPVPASLRHPDDTTSDDRHFIATLGRLWACGASPDWTQLWGDAPRRRVPLPTYPFQRSRYFIEPGKPALTVAEDSLAKRHGAVTDFGYRLAWRAAPADCLVDVETDLGTPMTWLMFADEAGLARAAAQRLRDSGHRVVTVHAGDAFARTGDDTYTLAPEHGREGYDALFADLALRDLAPARIGHFWLVTTAETFRPGSSFFHRNLEQGFWSLFFLGQALGEAGMKPMPHLTVVTSNAAQVRSERLANPEKAAVAGPVRVMPRELPGLTAAQLDVSLPEGRRAVIPAETVSLVLEELLAAPGNGFAALRGSRRFEQRLAPAPLPAPAEVPQGSVWVITGGFGGIGVTIAERLMRDHGARVALIGRSLPAPGGVRAGVIARLERLGQVLPLAADVCNPEDMRTALDRVRATLGRIHGVVHAAGSVDDAPLLGKDPGSAEAVLSAKVHGTKLLDQLLPDGSIERLVLFSSTSTVTSPAGQADYVAANEYLNAFARSRVGGKTKVVAVNWGIWSGIGMAADADARRQGKDAGAAPLPGMLVLERMTKADDGYHFEATLSASQWVMDDHRLKDGTAVLPGAAWPEIVAEAMSAIGAPAGFTLTDLTVFRPLRLEADMPRDLRVSVSKGRDGAYRMQARAREAAGWVLTAEAEISPLATPTGLVDLLAITARCPTRASAQGGVALPSAQEDRLAFGPRWQVLRATAIGQTEGIATLALPAQATTDADSCAVHPALFDIGTGWGLALLPPAPVGAIWVPVTLGTVRSHAPLPAEIRSWARLAGAPGADVASFDVTLTDPAGRVLIEVEGITFRSVSAEEVLARPAPPAPREVLADDARRSLSPAEERLVQALADGIRPAEGAEAFARALAFDAPQVLISSLDLPALVRQNNAVQADVAEGPGFARPELENDYLAPRTEVERVLAGFWADLLGVAQVGVEDDFFALGGHSLIAVRLFAMIRRQWKIDFPISVLFEAPTIARCAKLIADRIGPEEAAADPAAKADPAGPSFTHLVAMHGGEGGPKTPFFLVAGMFGNVLNLRHLAHLIGTDRPFYGLQARGLFGEAAPHMTIEDAAADCLAEIRQVQPKGPYLLGGFSGGGITAWDIARQLRAQGEDVALLVLLDTPLPVRPVPSTIDRALMKLTELRRGGPRFLAEWARRRIAWERSRRAVAANEPDPTVPSFNNAAIEAAFRHAVGIYQVTPWEDGRVVLYRPQLDRNFKVSGGNWISSEREYVFHDNQWSPFAPRLKVDEVPGNHDSMVLEPNVRVLASRLRAAIVEAEAAFAPDQAFTLTDRQVAAE